VTIDALRSPISHHLGEMNAPAPARILVVEDDDRIRAALRLALTDEGYLVEMASDGETALEAVATSPPALMLVDLMLPGLDGFEVCRRIRATHTLPIIVVSARDDSHDVVAGLEAGADDYVTKPFVFKELAARIRANLRRSAAGPASAAAAEETLELGGLTISSAQVTAWKAGSDLGLTATEFRLLHELASNPHRVFSREQLLESVWGYDYYGDLRIVDAHIRRLRTKVENDAANPALVVTVRGVGYKFVPGG
jgi:DNA-binding response OmpR family regulator